MKDLDLLFAALAQSKFRSSFRLNARDRQYLQNKGLPTVLAHAEDFITKRLQPARIPNDGKQTPFSGHPVFVAQHATATCCRACLEKWHGIPAGHELSAAQKAYLHSVLEHWLSRQART